MDATHIPPPPPALLNAPTEQGTTLTPTPFVNPNAIVPAPPTPAERVEEHVTAAVADTLHAIDIRAHLELLARTDPSTFRMWVQMVLPKQARGGPQQANIINVHNALPKSPLDALPPGFDAHR
jgi:hypothetical protein